MRIKWTGGIVNAHRFIFDSASDAARRLSILNDQWRVPLPDPLQLYRASRREIQVTKAIGEVKNPSPPKLSRQWNQLVGSSGHLSTVAIFAWRRLERSQAEAMRQ